MINPITVKASPIDSNTQSSIVNRKDKGVAVNNCSNTFGNNDKSIKFAATVPELHTIRTAPGSFFYIPMVRKTAHTVAEQIALLKSRGMQFDDEHKASLTLQNISYYRLKGYWWDMQSDYNTHLFKHNVYFETIIDRYFFDKELRLVLFNAIESVEIALRTQMIYRLSLAYDAMWYLNDALFQDKAKHEELVSHLHREFKYSKEIFIKEHKRKHNNNEAEAWKIMEIASMGTLSKFYKNLEHQLPEKSTIAKHFGLNMHTELSSWLEAITYTRNIIAHHSRLWSRNMVKRPTDKLNNPIGKWLNLPIEPVQSKKPFLIISALVYLCSQICQNNTVKHQILQLFDRYEDMPIYKLGFTNNWKEQNLWK